MPLVRRVSLASGVRATATRGAAAQLAATPTQSVRSWSTHAAQLGAVPTKKETPMDVLIRREREQSLVGGGERRSVRRVAWPRVFVALRCRAGAGLCRLVWQLTASLFCATPLAGQERIDKQQHGTGKLTARERIDLFLDPGVC